MTEQIAMFADIIKSLSFAIVPLGIMYFIQKVFFK